MRILRKCNLKPQYRINANFKRKEMQNYIERYGNTESQKRSLEEFNGDTVTKEYIITELPGSKMSWVGKDFDKKNKQSVKKVEYKYTYQMTPAEYSEYAHKCLNYLNNERSTVKKITSDRFCRSKKESTQTAK